MKLTFRLDDTQRQVARATVDLKRSRFRLDPRLLRRILLGAVPFPALAALNLYVHGLLSVTLLALFFGAFIVLWQIVVFGYSHGQITPKKLQVTNFYPRGVLIFAAIFWATLITFVCVSVYLKLSRV